MNLPSKLQADTLYEFAQIIEASSPCDDSAAVQLASHCDTHGWGPLPVPVHGLWCSLTAGTGNQPQFPADERLRFNYWRKPFCVFFFCKPELRLYFAGSVEGREKNHCERRVDDAFVFSIFRQVTRELAEKLLQIHKESHAKSKTNFRLTRPFWNHLSFVS